MAERSRNWDDGDRVAHWVAKDARRRAVQTARDLAVATVAGEQAPLFVVELAAGAGTFLGSFLEAFPHARGLWSDRSSEMVRHARKTLAPFADRVDYLLSDLRCPGFFGGGTVDVLICARATHVLDTEELGAFYRQAASLLRPGGWLINLDHVAASGAWSRRYDGLVVQFYDGAEAGRQAGQVKDRGGHRLETHLELLAATGLTDLDTPWRLLSTVLMMARRPV